MSDNLSNAQMKVMWVYDGRPERIPNIGEHLQMKPHLFFVVEGYGESNEIKGPNGILKVCEIELFGHILIPEGSPIEVLEDLLEKGL